MTENKSYVVYIEYFVILIALFFCIKWVINPQRAFEPIIALCTIFLTIIDLWRRNRSHIDTPEVTKLTAPIQPNQTTDKNLNRSKIFSFASSCAFFSHRFAQAFPGIRVPKWYQGKQAIERLAILLAEPLQFTSTSGGEKTPIWWFRDGNMPIEDFRISDNTTVLLDHKELAVKRIYAAYTENYKLQFVYLEANPSLPTGLYPRTSDAFNSAKQEFGYVWEEYGIFNGSHKVTRAEYDDNATQIMGAIVPFKNNCELRIRYLTGYNFIICAQESPINNPSFDQSLVSYMNRLLEGDDCIAEFTKLIGSLPPFPNH